MRAGFVTTAYRNGVSDEDIMGNTRHSGLTTMRSYVRRRKLGGQAHRASSICAGGIGVEVLATPVFVDVLLENVTFCRVVAQGGR
jgi:hypothetical protein